MSKKPHATTKKTALTKPERETAAIAASMIAKHGKVRIPMISGRGAQQKSAKAAPADGSKVKMTTPAKIKTSKRDGMSGLDAAARVLGDAGKPLTSQETVDAMLKRGLWKTDGKTPHATIYAAIIREIAKKGSASRFRKTERGHFTVTAHAKGAK